MAVASSGPMQIICTSLQTDNRASTSSPHFLCLERDCYLLVITAWGICNVYA